MNDIFIYNIIFIYNGWDIFSNSDSRITLKKTLESVHVSN